MNILELKSVSYRYRGARKYTLADINIGYEKNKLYAIMGKSGSGKTTLLSLLSGLDVPVSGEILFNGKSLKSINRDDYRAKNIGVVFQSYNLITNATALENVLLSMDISEVKKANKKEYAYELLQSVGLDRETVNRKILKLSGGEQQRVAIARALANNSDIIIADEPTGNLDKETERDIMNIFKSLAHESNKCVIVVTHSDRVASYADELWGIKKGKLMIG